MRSRLAEGSFCGTMIRLGWSLHGVPPRRLVAGNCDEWPKEPGFLFVRRRFDALSVTRTARSRCLSSKWTPFVAVLSFFFFFGQPRYVDRCSSDKFP